MIRSSDPKFALRHELATYAIKKGIKAAARCYECSRNTVRKWVRRFALNRNQGLFPVSRAPHCCPHKTPPALEAKCVAKPKHSPGFGSRRLIAEFDLKIGHNALDRIFREHQLTRQPKRRHKRKNDLRAVKAAYAPFTRFQMDTKHLTDIPFYWPQMQANGLPRFQYTIRELSCGAQFLAYSNELSKTYATFAVERLLQHLKNHGLDTSRIILATDLGCEFDGDTTHYQLGSFHLTIEQKYQARHRFNPPACPNANADVESVHNTVETELFDAQVFSSKADFFAKTATCQLWHNAARKNSSRGYKSPADLLAIKAPHISPKIFLLHPIPLESLLHQQGGHDVPGRPGKFLTFLPVFDCVRLMPLASKNIVPLLFVAFIAWRVITRVRRNVGRQPVRTSRLVSRIVIYSLLCVFLGLVAMNHPKVMAALGGGLVVGIPLALVGLRFTRFETTPAGRFYTPNAYIGVTISLLFIIRLFYRLSTVVTGSAQFQQQQQHPQLMQSPLTYFFFGILAGYYIAYFAGILIACNKPVVGQPSSVA